MDSRRIYTPEEIVSIKENLKRAFGTEFVPIDIKLGNLIKGKDKREKFKFIKGENFVFFNAHPNSELGLSVGWHIIEITYQRLDLVFYKITTSSKPSKESYANKDSYFINNIMPVLLNIDRFNIPEQNLPLLEFDKGKNNPVDIAITKGKNNDFIKLV